LRVFIDTSAMYAYLDSSDANNDLARQALSEHFGNSSIETHSYALLETAAVVHRRLGDSALSALFNALAPAFKVEFVSEELHKVSVAAFLAGSPSRISLVDRTSFEFMRRRRIDTAIAFDRDFTAEGFTTIPSNTTDTPREGAS
jgi:predicted nucleic acid-binding protein